MTKSSVEKRNESEQAERKEAELVNREKAMSHVRESEATECQSDIITQIGVCDDSAKSFDSDACKLAQMIWEFLADEMHKTLGMNSLKAVAEQWQDEDSVISSESSLRDFRDLGAVRYAVIDDSEIEMPTKLQAGRILKKGFKVKDLSVSAEFKQRMRMFTEARLTHPEIESATLAVTADTCGGTIASVIASSDAEKEDANTPKTDAEKCEIQFTNFLNAVQKLNAEDGKAKIAECKARMKLSDLEFTG